MITITCDPVKHAETLAHRALDFYDAAIVFAGRTATVEDVRRDYGERRFRTAGYLRGRLVVIMWTPRGTVRRVFSMRYCHAKEERKWIERMG